MEAHELIQKLNSLNGGKYDEEANHVIADNLLLEYINNPEVTKAFESVDKWYS